MDTEGVDGVRHQSVGSAGIATTAAESNPTRYFSLGAERRSGDER
ncbi:hypothetical protein SAMN05216278_3237 [Halopelagius longus]|uniref:Uncharacterized protein n=1 Tax=Halopelagius longus TaxID=1236180 RepID=A0A1H1FIF8_9EURY|nr:hypothetical protein SAMN05216278_3237 [Halopelagius longus]